MTPDEAVARIKAALAEVGYPDAHVVPTTDGAHLRWYVPTRTLKKEAAWWAACNLSGYLPPGCRHQACWPCWKEGTHRDAKISDECINGNCQHPDEPRWPPRDLLRRPEPAR